MASEDHYDIVKEALLNHIREVFEEIEEEMARYHEEKYAMLEDSLNNASDAEELQVAFGQWFNDHSEDLDLEYDVEDLWQNALGNADIDL